MQRIERVQPGCGQQPVHCMLQAPPEIITCSEVHEGPHQLKGRDAILEFHIADFNIRHSNTWHLLGP